MKCHLNADGLISTGQGLLSGNMFIYCLNNPIGSKDENGYVCCSSMDGAAASSVPQTSNAETNSDYCSVPNVVGAVAGTVIGCVENYTRTAAGYIYNGVINFYPKTSITQTFKPYSHGAARA